MNSVKNNASSFVCTTLYTVPLSKSLAFCPAVWIPPYSPLSEVVPITTPITTTHHSDVRSSHPQITKMEIPSTPNCVISCQLYALPMITLPCTYCIYYLTSSYDYMTHQWLLISWSLQSSYSSCWRDCRYRILAWRRYKIYRSLKWSLGIALRRN